MLVVPVPMVEVPVDVSGPRCLAGSRHRTVQTLAQPSQAKLAICSQGEPEKVAPCCLQNKTHIIFSESSLLHRMGQVLRGALRDSSEQFAFPPARHGLLP